MLMYSRFAAVVMLAVACSVASRAEVRVSGVFGDHMVLQRDVPVSVWGRADAGESVRLQLGAKSTSTTAGADGKWSASLPAMSAGGPFEMTITGKNTVTIRDILVGDVWLCSGQSNMGTGFARREPALDPGDMNLPKVRYVGIPNVASVNTPDDAPTLKWMVSGPDTVPSYATVPWYFGQMIHQKTGVPIGIIKANWGGATAENWMAPDSMNGIGELGGLRGDFDYKLKLYKENLPRNTKMLADWLRAAEEAGSKGLEVPSIPAVDLNPIYAPPLKTGFFCMYNGMISYLTQFPIKGVTWYQGESNVDDGPIYYSKMLALINGWRKAWNRPDMPFYFVQLPNVYGASGLPDPVAKSWPLMREVQARCLAIPNTGMAVTIDIGDDDLHPRNKYDTGRRLAAIALAKDYGVKIEYAAPAFKRSEVKGSKVVLTFDQLGLGLMVGKKDGTNPTVEDKQGKLQEFAVAGLDRKFYAADAVIEGDSVVVSCESVQAPVAVRYAFTWNPARRNLYGRNGLPVAPFRTDSW